MIQSQLQSLDEKLDEFVVHLLTDEFGEFDERKWLEWTALRRKEYLVRQLVECGSRSIWSAVDWKWIHSTGCASQRDYELIPELRKVDDGRWDHLRPKDKTNEERERVKQARAKLLENKL